MSINVASYKFHDIVQALDQVYIPVTTEEGGLIHLKTPKAPAVVTSYDPELQLIGLRFSDREFLHGLRELNDRVLQHVYAFKETLWGKSLDDEGFHQKFRPFIVDDHVYMYTWQARVVNQRGVPIEGASLDPSMIGAGVRMYFDMKGVSLKKDIFGAPLTALSVYVVHPPRAPTPEPEPEHEPLAEAPVDDIDCFSDDEHPPAPDEQPIFQEGILQDPHAPLSLGDVPNKIVT